MFGEGISREGGLIDFGVENEIVKKSGAWYTFEGEQLGQGKENSRRFLRENPALAKDIEQRIRVKLGIGVPRAVADLPVAAVEPEGAAVSEKKVVAS
jgi:recombination protein RecA